MTAETNPVTELELGSYLFKQYGPEGLRGPLFDDKTIDKLTESRDRARARASELAHLRDDDQRFIKEINEAIVDPEIKVIMVVCLSRSHKEIIRRHLIELNQRRVTRDEIVYIDGTRVLTMSESSVGMGRGCRADKLIVHEAIGWKDYTERIWPALAPCLLK